MTKGKDKTTRASKATEVIDYSKPLKNWQWEQFCMTYLTTNNGAEAARVAKYSEKGVNGTGSRLLSSVSIAGRIAYLQGKLAEKCDITAQRVIAEYAKIAFANTQDLLLEGNSIKDISQVPREISAAVSSVTVDTRYDGGSVEKGKSRGYVEKVKFTMHSKTQALDALGKHLGVFEKDNEQKGQVLIPIQIILQHGEVQS